MLATMQVRWQLHPLVEPCGVWCVVCDFQRSTAASTIHSKHNIHIVHTAGLREQHLGHSVTQRPPMPQLVHVGHDAGGDGGETGLCVCVNDYMCVCAFNSGAHV